MALSEILQIIQSVGIITAIAFTLYQVSRSRQERLRHSYLELNKRYIEVVRQSIDLEDPPVGYDNGLLRNFYSQGGTKKELLFYDLVFASWESAYLLFREKKPNQWSGWDAWIRAFFLNNPRCQLAWEIAGRYFDQEFVVYIDDEIDFQALRTSPENQDH